MKNLPLPPGVRTLLCLSFALSSGFSLLARAAEPMAEQMLYLPIYSHVYFGDLDKDGQPNEKLLSAHVSIRNTDPRASIRVLYARYYNTAGKLVKDFITAPKTIAPMGTAELFVPRSDASGGSGANFVIGWKAEGAVNPPLAQAIHATIDMSRTLVFTTEGRPIQNR